MLASLLPKSWLGQSIPPSSARPAARIAESSAWTICCQVPTRLRRVQRDSHKPRRMFPSPSALSAMSRSRSSLWQRRRRSMFRVKLLPSRCSPSIWRAQYIKESSAITTCRRFRSRPAASPTSPISLPEPSPSNPPIPPKPASRPSQPVEAPDLTTISLSTVATIRMTGSVAFCRIFLLTPSRNSPFAPRMKMPILAAQPPAPS